MMTSKTRQAFRLLVLSACTASVIAWFWPTTSTEAGKRLYREGLLASGQLLQANIQGNLQLSGAQAACGNCHRRSGFGTSEGGLTVRPITGPALFVASTTPVYAASVNQSIRPAYTNETFTRALREGLDVTGRPLHPAMPRYTLDETSLKNLIGYLKTLAAATSPGVTSDTIHFATVITEDVAPEKRQAMLTVLETFVRDKNAGTRSETLRAKRAGWDMQREYQAYRKWQIHVWELTGGSETWPSQLAKLYRQQPVFALLSGITAGTWRPVHDFCEQFEIPCLFPNVDAPPSEERDYYSFYFSKGVILEAQSLAYFLNKHPEEIGAGPIVQVFRNNAVSAAAANAFRAALNNQFDTLIDIPLDSDQPLADSVWSDLISSKAPSIVVLWLNEAELVRMKDIFAVKQPSGSRLYLSSSLAAALLSKLPPAFDDNIRFLHAFELPDQLDRRLLRTDAWLKARKINIIDQRIQANTLFALTQTGNALMHLLDNFSREYFIELLEHGVENSVITSVYPRLSIGPGQRFAAKVCAIIQPIPGEAGKWATVTD